MPPSDSAPPLSTRVAARVSEMRSQVAGWLRAEHPRIDDARRRGVHGVRTLRIAVEPALANLRERARRAGIMQRSGSDDTGEYQGTTPPVGGLVRDGELVRLRTEVPANRPAFQRWYADPEIARLLRHDQEPLTDIQSRGYFDTIILPLSARGLCYAIHEAATDALIGMAALTDLQPGGSSALYRIVIGEKDRWGRGYGTEATRLVAWEAFATHDLREIRLEVFRHNPRAMSAYRRVGFQEVGEHVEWVDRQQVQLDVVEMRLGRDVFLALESDHANRSIDAGDSPAATT